MAQVYGNIEPGNLKQELTPIVMLVGIAVAAVSIMFWSKENMAFTWPAMGLAGIALTGFLLTAYGTVHRRALQRIFMPSAHRQNIELDRRVIEQFGRMDDNCFVFNHFIFELCRVEHLVISPNGIFVVTKTAHRGDLSVIQDTLFIGDKSLETLTGNTWRVCHLIKIILQKWFDTDYLPQPVLAVDGLGPAAVADYDGIAIVSIDDLGGFLGDGGKEIEPETARSFAGFVGDRYVRR